MFCQYSPIWDQAGSAGILTGFFVNAPKTLVGALIPIRVLIDSISAFTLEMVVETSVRFCKQFQNRSRVLSPICLAVFKLGRRCRTIPYIQINAKRMLKYKIVKNKSPLLLACAVSVITNSKVGAGLFAVTLAGSIKITLKKSITTAPVNANMYTMYKNVKSVK